MKNRFQAEIFRVAEDFCNGITCTYISKIRGEKFSTRTQKKNQLKQNIGKGFPSHSHD